ncbi:MAG: P-loop NTPase [Candidatus Micrarchaeota archaeon]|nr:P-loop NTPase [Candidatus Micrarchaeota archaeon]
MAENEEHMHPSFMGVLKQKERVRAKLSGIKHKIGVYSAKGGVGKTTIAVNIAYTLSRMGYKVGLLDADIDCPNVTMFLGIDRMIGITVPIRPLEHNGVRVASTAMLVDEVKRPIIWRGPIITKMLGDFFENTEWGELDYLIVDLPPGTSDAPLTIMQLLDLDGFVIVTTPQRIASINAIRSGLMARRLGVSVLGIVENMSDGEASENAREVGRTLGTEKLFSVGRDQSFNAFSDSGRVAVVEDDGKYAEFRKLVGELLAAS